MTRTIERALLDAMPAIQAFEDGKGVYAVINGIVGQTLSRADDDEPDWNDTAVNWHIVEPPKTRPMNAEEWFERRYCIVKRKLDGMRFHVEQASCESVLLGRSGRVGCWRPFADMARDYTFDDGTPCEVTE